MISLKRIDISSDKVYNNVVEYHGICVHFIGGLSWTVI